MTHVPQRPIERAEGLLPNPVGFAEEHHQVCMLAAAKLICLASGIAVPLMTTARA